MEGVTYSLKQVADLMDGFVPIEKVYSSGGGSVAIAKGFAAAEADNTFTVGYRDGAFYMESATLAVTETADGQPFDGFVRDKVWLTVEFLQPGEDAELRVTDINGQPIIR